MNPNDELSSERANRIADAVESIERNVSRLREVQSLNLEEYKSSANRELRDATERKFEKLIEAVLDIAESILKQEGIDVPSRRKATIESVETEGVIDTGLADRLREAVGFRDILSHTYGPVVNDDIVYDAVQNSLSRYVEFVEAVDEYLSGTSP